jgi:Zn-dependent peptidase ImmA (M78 family)
MSTLSPQIERVFSRAAEMGIVDDLVRLSGLTAVKLSSIRAGAPVTTTDYEALCRGLAVDPSAMYRGEDRSPLRTVARFRSATSQASPSPLDVRLLALAAEQGRILGFLLKLLGRQVVLASHRSPAVGQSSHETWKEGYDRGEAARRGLHNVSGPVVDIESLFRELGVHVAKVAFSSSSIDAASIWESGSVPVILLNTKAAGLQHPGILRATLAHELCHLLHDAGEQDVTTLVSWTEGTGNYRESVEVRARAFAPAFLAPRDQVVPWVAALAPEAKESNYALVKNLAECWGLSFEGAAWHAKNCRIVPADDAERLAHSKKKPRLDLARFTGVGVGSTPPAMIHAALPDEPAPLWDGWATEIVLSAMEDDHITVGRARELLTWR